GGGRVTSTTPIAPRSARRLRPTRLFELGPDHALADGIDAGARRTIELADQSAEVEALDDQLLDVAGRPRKRRLEHGRGRGEVRCRGAVAACHERVLGPVGKLDLLLAAAHPV